jgi:ApbE superfamily uncharacterized protein (UPF0280 family)
MAGTRRTDLLGRLADMSEDAIQKLSDAPGADRVLGALNTLKDRTDDLQKRVRGLEDLEKRLAAVEAKVAKLSKAEKNAKGTATTKSSAETPQKND